MGRPLLPPSPPTTHRTTHRTSRIPLPYFTRNPLLQPSTTTHHSRHTPYPTRIQNPFLAEREDSNRGRSSSPPMPALVPLLPQPASASTLTWLIPSATSWSVFSHGNIEAVEEIEEEIEREVGAFDDDDDDGEENGNDGQDLTGGNESENLDPELSFWGDGMGVRRGDEDENGAALHSHPVYPPHPPQPHSHPLSEDEDPDPDTDIIREIRNTMLPPHAHAHAHPQSQPQTNHRAEAIRQEYRTMFSNAHAGILPGSLANMGDRGRRDDGSGGEYAVRPAQEGSKDADSDPDSDIETETEPIGSERHTVTVYLKGRRRC